MVEGRDPRTGEPLVAGRERTVRAFDLTFSAPKSVSLLWAFGSERVAEVVAEAHREAVAEALGFLAKGSGGPGTSRWGAPLGGDRGLGTGRVRAPHEPRATPSCTPGQVVRAPGAGLDRDTRGPGRPGREVGRSVVGVPMRSSTSVVRALDGGTRGGQAGGRACASGHPAGSAGRPLGY